MVLVLKHWKSRSSPGIIADGLGTNPFTISKKPLPVHTARRLFRLWIPSRRHTYGTAGWSSPVARQAHNLKVVGSNPTPATTFTELRYTSGIAALFEAAFLVSKLSLNSKKPPTHWISVLKFGCGGWI